MKAAIGFGLVAVGVLAAAAQSCTSAGATSGDGGDGGGSDVEGGRGGGVSNAGASNADAGMGARPNGTGGAGATSGSDSEGGSGQNGGGTDSGTGGLAPGGEGGTPSVDPGDPCAGNPCKNSGSCSVQGTSFKCACATGYEGTRCETNINDCPTNACKNGGMCVDGIGTYTCTCARGFTGKSCDLPRFEGLTPIRELSIANAVSGDGNVVVGTSAPGGRSPSQPFKWTAAGKFQDLSSTEPIDYGFAADVNNDGSVIVGQAQLGTTGGAFRWTPTGGMTLIGAGDGSRAEGVSPNGNTITGVANSGSFRWTTAGVVQPLTTLAGRLVLAQDVSASGSIIVGSADNGPGTSNAAFRWTAGDGVLNIAPTNAPSNANAISDDGTVIVGSYFNTTTNDSRACRWTGALGNVQSDIPVGALTITNATAVSANGSVIVGDSLTGGWIWNGTGNARPLLDVLTELGADVTGWSRLRPLGISADGTVIVGSGDDANSGTCCVQAWIARLGTH